MEFFGVCVKARFCLCFYPILGVSQYFAVYHPPPWGSAGSGARRQLWAPLLPPPVWWWLRGSLGRGEIASISRALVFLLQWRSLADPRGQSCCIPPLFIAGEALMRGIPGKPAPRDGTEWDGLGWNGAGLFVAVGCSSIHHRLLPGHCVYVLVSGRSSCAQQNNCWVPTPIPAASSG